MDRPVGTAPAFGAKWTSLNPPLTPWIMDVINKMGFVNMTPVQSGTIPRAIKNQDCVVEAVTGSGKTLSFVIPVLERICRNERKYKKGEVAAVVIAPTRELATQIHDVFHHFLFSLIPEPEPEPETEQNQAAASSSRSRSASPAPKPTEPAPYPLPMLVTSGTPTPYETFLSLQSNILIGTPGRLASFLLSPRGLSVVRVSELDVLVLDEADRLLSAPDHRRDVERIMRHLPKQRRTHLFSATMTDAVEEMIGLGLRNPVRIVVNLKDKKKKGEEEAKERRTPTSLQNTYLVCRHAEKTLQLVRILQAEVQKHESAKFIVYFSTCAAVDYFYRILSRLPALSKYHLTSLHGDLPPRIRETALNNFTSHPSSHLKPAVLLCTDVAARGVDFPDIDVVVQYDAPTDPKSFSHRAGRTARAGRRGKAVVLLGQGREQDYVEFLNVRKIPLTEQKYLNASLEPFDPPEAVDEDAISLLAQIRKIVLTDRELADKGAKAFVSALQAYRKHEASFIFRLADLDFNAIAISYGLLRMPAMPEIKDWRRKRELEVKKREKMLAEGKEVGEQRVVLDWRDEDVDWDTFAYASKTREASRQANLVKRATINANTAPLTESEIAAKKAKRRIKAEMKEAWSDQKDRKSRKEERREKMDKRRQAQWEQAQKALVDGNGDGGDRAGNGNGGNAADIEAARLSAFAPIPRASGKKRADKNEDGEGGSDMEEMGVEYKALKKEMKEERASKKSKRDNQVSTGGMFDDLE
ncbi:hypothetical protein IAU59_001836 [Kwoniella sp. CBS 9459]